MAAQHLPRNLVPPSSGLKELAQTTKKSKAANPLFVIAFSRFCQREFVYDTGSVYFTSTFIHYTL